MLTASIIHHFRFFKKFYWCRTEGFNERIKNAVDYDMFLKLSEVCEVKHLNIVGYRRRLHGQNTSILNSKDQIKNTAKVINMHLERLESGFQCELINENSPQLIYTDTLKRITYVDIKEEIKTINFTVHTKNNDIKVAFYLYNGNKHIDTQWYSKNVSFILNKKKYGKGQYKVRYFIVNDNNDDPGNDSNKKEIGISKSVTVT